MFPSSPGVPEGSGDTQVSADSAVFRVAEVAEAEPTSPGLEVSLPEQADRPGAVPEPPAQGGALPTSPGLADMEGLDGAAVSSLNGDDATSQASAADRVPGSLPIPPRLRFPPVPTTPCVPVLSMNDIFPTSPDPLPSSPGLPEAGTPFPESPGPWPAIDGDASPTSAPPGYFIPKPLVGTRAHDRIAFCWFRFLLVAGRVPFRIVSCRFGF